MLKCASTLGMTRSFRCEVNEYLNLQLAAFVAMVSNCSDISGRSTQQF